VLASATLRLRPAQGQRAAAARESSVHDDPLRALRRAGQRHAAVAAGAGALGQACAIVDDEALRIRRYADRDAAPVVAGTDHEFGGLPVHEQRIGQQVVGAPAAAVEVAGTLIERAEAALVDDDVAADALQPAVAQVAGQTPPALDRQQRVAAPLQIQVAVEHAVAHRCIGPHPGLPGVRGAEDLERGPGRQQLHRRGRGARRGGVQLDHGGAARDLAHDDGHVGVRHELLFQHGARLRRQIVGGGRAGEQDGQQQDRETATHLVQY